MKAVLPDSSEKRTHDGSYCRLATAAAFASLFSYAIVLLVTQSLNNQVVEHYGASLAQLGWLAPALMGGFFVAVLVGGHYSDRIGKLPVLALGCICMGGGALIFGVAPTFGVAAAGMLVMGIGGGFSEGTASALVTDLYTGPRRASVMNLAQAAFGVGAVIVPIATGALIRANVDWRLAYFATTAICLLTAALTLAAMFKRVEKPVGTHAESGWSRILVDPLVLMLSLGILLYVGAELGQSNWTSIYFRRELHAAEWVAAMSVSAMWLGILAGRMAAAVMLKYLCEYALLCWCLAFGAVAESALLLVRSPVPGLVAAFAVGLFFGPVWPTIVSRAGSAYPNRTGLVTAVVVSVGSLGAAISPAVIGAAADVHGIRSALWICVVLLCINLAVFIHLRARNHLAA